SPFVSVDLFSGLPSRQRQTQLARKATPAWLRNTRLGLLFLPFPGNADGHPKVAVKLAAEDLLQLSTPRPRGHVAHEHPLPSPRRPRPLPAAREVREHPKERDIHEYAAVVVVHEDDHALLVAGKMNVLEVGGLEVDGLDFGGLEVGGLEVGGLEVRGTPTGPFLEVGGLEVRGTPTGPFLEVGGLEVRGTPTGPSHTSSGRHGSSHPHAP